MEVIFEIPTPASLDWGQCVLIGEVSADGFSYAIKDEAGNSFVGLGVYQYSKNTPDAAAALKELFQEKEVLSQPFQKVVMTYAFAQNVFIPFSLYESEKAADVLNLVHGDLQNDDAILSDEISACSSYNIYRAPVAIYKVMQAQFPKAENVHQHSILLNRHLPEADKLSLIFYSKRIVVTLVAQEKVQLVNSFEYLTADDVIYTLLNIRKQFGLEDVPVEISGLLDKNSLLYKEIYNYFSTVFFATLPAGSTYAEEISRHPAHYFSHIFAVDQCV